MSKSLSSEERLKIYTLAVEMADRTSARRLLANSFFITLQGGVVAAVSLFINSQDGFNAATYASIAIFATLGMIIGVAWALTIKSYSDLNAAKFGVILKMEEKMPIKPMTDEWALLETEEYLEWKRQISKQNKPKKIYKWLRERKEYYTPQSSVEKYIPITLLIAYFALLVFAAQALVRY